MMSKMDTKELEKLRKGREDSYSEVYKLVTLVTCGDEGRFTVMEKVKAHGDANKALAVYEATHKGIVKYAEAKKEKECGEKIVWPGYSSFLNNMLYGDASQRKPKGKKKPVKLKIRRPVRL